MQGFDAQSAKQYILRHMDKRPFRSLANRLEEIVDDFITYDLHFMRLTGVLDEDGLQGPGAYDDVEAFEYIYDAWLSDHPQETDEDMAVAAVLNAYMQWQERYLILSGLADV